MIIHFNRKFVQNRNISVATVITLILSLSLLPILGQMGGYYSPYTGGFTAAQMAAAAAAAAAQQTTQVRNAL